METHVRVGAKTCAALVAWAWLAAGVAQAAPIVFSANAPDAPGIQGTVDAFRAALGTLNPNTPVNNPDGRREINWDAVPAARSDPNAFPGDFFNANVAPRARGIEFLTPGTGFLVSTNEGENGGQPVRFGFPGDFVPFSAQKLFTPVGSTITDVFFFTPADQVTPAVTDGFGAVFSDVEMADSSRMEYFDRDGTLLASTFVAPGASGSLSFLGVAFDSPVLARVRITTGDLTFLANGRFATNGTDGVVMDDFIYGEPQAVRVPEPASALLLATALLGLARWRRRE